jgi:hypothetical protein
MIGGHDPNLRKNGGARAIPTGASSCSSGFAHPFSVK